MQLKALPGKIRQAIFFLREYFYPFGCSICGVDLLDPKETWYGLCKSCHAGIERELSENHDRKACDFCGKPLISEHGRCIPCRLREGSAFDRAVVLFPYMGKYRRLLASYKFGKNLALGNFFVEKIRCTLGQFALPPEAQIVPVPPRPGKIRNSGWDQVECLARLLERGQGSRNCLPVNRCLRRLPSQSQKELNRENRQSNLQKRIVPIRQAPKTSVLIDDVMTTGATLDACAAALKEGGAETVYCLCLFYD